MPTETQPDKNPGGCSVYLDFPKPIAEPLQGLASELTAQEGRKVTVTEILRREAIRIARERVAA